MQILVGFVQWLLGIIASLLIWCVGAFIALADFMAGMLGLG